MSDAAAPNMAAAALALARAGLAVFPVWPAVPLPGGGWGCGCGKLSCNDVAKHPMGNIARHGVDDASIDEHRVRWFWACRSDANIGMATGSIAVLDVDPRHRGDAALAALEAEHGPLPVTWRVTTGGGGEHVYFRTPGGVDVANSAGRLASGLDIRGRGGYTIAPPSLHESGRRYAWQPGHDPEGVPLAPLPPWLLALLSKSNTKRDAVSATAWRELVRRGVAEGERNDAVTRLAGHLLRHYVDALVVLDLLQAWNISRCQPPLDPAEITRTVNSVTGREMKRRARRSTNDDG